MKAVEAWEKGVFDDEVMHVPVHRASATPCRRDGIPRADTTLEKLSHPQAGVRPQVRDRHGRQQLTAHRRRLRRAPDGGGDGRAARLHPEGLRPVVGVRRPRSGLADADGSVVRHARSPSTAAGMTLDDIDVIDMHEAFAAQMLSNMAAFKSKQWAQKYLGRDEAIGEIDPREAQPLRRLDLARPPVRRHRRPPGADDGQRAGAAGPWHRPHHPMCGRWPRRRRHSRALRSRRDNHRVPTRAHPFPVLRRRRRRRHGPDRPGGRGDEHARPRPGDGSEHDHRAHRERPDVIGRRDRAAPSATTSWQAPTSAGSRRSTNAAEAVDAPAAGAGGLQPARAAPPRPRQAGRRRHPRPLPRWRHGTGPGLLDAHRIQRRAQDPARPARGAARDHARRRRDAATPPAGRYRGGARPDPDRALGPAAQGPARWAWSTRSAPRRCCSTWRDARRRRRPSASRPEQASQARVRQVQELRWRPRISSSWPSRRTRLAARSCSRRPRSRCSQTTQGNYPAPKRRPRAVKIGIEKGIEAGYAAEARGVRRARRLAGGQGPHVDLLRQPGAQEGDPGSTRRRRAASRSTKVGVLGGGLMGGGIAAVNTTKAGASTRIKEIDDAGVGRGLGYVAQDARRPGEAAPDEATRRPSRRCAMVTGTIDYSGFGDVDLVIEAVFEDLDAEAVDPPGRRGRHRRRHDLRLQHVVDPDHRDRRGRRRGPRTSSACTTSRRSRRCRCSRSSSPTRPPTGSPPRALTSARGRARPSSSSTTAPASTPPGSSAPT